MCRTCGVALREKPGFLLDTTFECPLCGICIQGSHRFMEGQVAAAKQGLPTYVPIKVTTP